MRGVVMIVRPMIGGVVVVVRMGSPTVRVLVEMFVRVLVAMRMGVFVPSSKTFQRGQGLFHLFVLPGGLLRHEAETPGGLFRADLLGLLGHAAVGLRVVLVVPDRVLQAYDELVPAGERWLLPRRCAVVVVMGVVHFPVVVVMLRVTVF